MSYISPQKRLMKVATVGFMSSLLHNDIFAEGCACSARNRNDDIRRVTIEKRKFNSDVNRLINKPKNIKKRPSINNILVNNLGKPLVAKSLEKLGTNNMNYNNGMPKPKDISFTNFENLDKEEAPANIFSEKNGLNSDFLNTKKFDSGNIFSYNVSNKSENPDINIDENVDTPKPENTFIDNEDNIDKSKHEDINKSENIEDKPKSTDINQDSINLEVNDERFANLRAIIDDLEQNKYDSLSTLFSLIYNEEKRLLDEFGDELGTSLSIVNEKVLDILLNLVVNSLSILLGQDVDDISRYLYLQKYKRYMTSFSDPDVANMVFSNVSKNLEILSSCGNLTPRNLAANLWSVLKDVKNVESTFDYCIYSDIASLLLKFIVDLQNKLILLFPSLYNGTEKEFTIRLDVARKDFIGNIGSSLSSFKLVEMMLDTNFDILKSVSCNFYNVSQPLFEEEPDSFKVSSNSICLISGFLALFNSEKSRFYQFLSKYIFSIDLKGTISSPSGVKVKSFKDALNPDVIVGSVQLKNKRSKKNCKLSSFQFI